MWILQRAAAVSVLAGAIVVATGAAMAAPLTAPATAPAPAADQTQDRELTPAQQSAFASRLFARRIGPKKTYACFKAHVAAAAASSQPHVTDMVLLLSAEYDPEAAGLQYGYRLNVRVQNRTGLFEAMGGCSNPMVSMVSADRVQLGCWVDCDGGGFTTELADQDRAVDVRLSGIRLTATVETEPVPEFPGGAPGSQFRLSRVSLHDCGALIEQQEQLSMLSSRPAGE